MKKTYDETPVNKDPLFLQFLRYAAVIVVSVCLLALLICSIAAKDDVWLICFIFIAFMAFYITIPIIALWIYSFVLAIMRFTKTDKILLYFHIADILLLGIFVCVSNLPLENATLLLWLNIMKGKMVGG